MSRAPSSAVDPGSSLFSPLPPLFPYPTFFGSHQSRLSLLSGQLSKKQCANNNNKVIVVVVVVTQTTMDLVIPSCSSFSSPDSSPKYNVPTTMAKLLLLLLLLINPLWLSPTTPVPPLLSTSSFTIENDNNKLGVVDVGSTQPYLALTNPISLLTSISCWLPKQ